MSEKTSSSSLLEAIKLKLGKLPKSNDDSEKKPTQNYFADNSKDIPQATNNSEKTDLFEGLKNIDNIDISNQSDHKEEENESQKDLDDESVNVKNISQKINNKTNLKEVNSLEIDEENSEEDLEEIKLNEQKIEAPTTQKTDIRAKEIDPIEMELQKLEAELEQKKKQQKPEIKIEDLDLTEENLSQNTSLKPQEMPPENEQSIIEAKAENKTTPLTSEIISELNNEIIKEEIVKNPEIKSSQNNLQLPDSKEAEIKKNENLANEDPPINASANLYLPQNSTEIIEDNFHELRSKISNSSSFNFSPTLKYFEEIEQNTESKKQENKIFTETQENLQVNKIKSEEPKNIENKNNEIIAPQQKEFENENQKSTEIKTDIINNIESSTKISEEKIEIKDSEIEKIEITADNISGIENAEIKQFKLKDYKETAIQDISVAESMSYKIQDIENELIKNSMNAIKQELTSNKLNLEDFDEPLENIPDNLSLQSNFNNPNLEKISHNLIHEETIYQSTNSIKKLMEAKNIVKKVNDSFANDELLNKIAVNIMEPKLEKWLNDNLPSLVEEIVRKEIEKIIPK